jgi:DNA-binding transcriptional LysR family regulator
MELYNLKVFMTVANERSFSRAADTLQRTQPAITLAVQKLERDLGEKLLDRAARDLTLTDCGRVVLEYSRRFDNLERELQNSLVELRDVSAGRLVIGANETTSLYLMQHIVNYRRRYPKVKVMVRRSSSSRIPAQVIDGDLEFGVISFDPEDERLDSHVLCRDHLAFVVSPEHRLAQKEAASIQELGGESFVTHHVASPYRDTVLKAFQRAKVPLNLDLEMPTIETIRLMVTRNEGVAFLPGMCIERDVKNGDLKEVKVRELRVEREVRLIFPACRILSHAAKAFNYVVTGPTGMQV